MPKWCGGHSDIFPFVPLPRCDISHGAVGILVRWLVFYSMAQADVYSYVPSESVYDTPAGAYIMQDPPGLDARQLVAVPADE